VTESVLSQMMKRNKTGLIFFITSIAFFWEEIFSLHQLARILSAYWTSVLAQESGPFSLQSKHWSLPIFPLAVTDVGIVNILLPK